MIIHGEFEMPIRSLVFQSGRIRDFGLGGAWVCAGWTFLERVRCCDSRAIWGLCFDF
jgi:hypothetical protein